MICENCGSEINDSAAFCSTCGAKMSASDVNSGNEKSETVYEQPQALDKLQFLKQPDNIGIKKKIDNNLTFTMIFIVITLIDSAYMFYSDNLVWGLRLGVAIVVLVEFNKLKKTLDAKLCKSVFLMSIFTIAPFLIFELFSLKNNIKLLDQKYEEFTRRN